MLGISRRRFTKGLSLSLGVAATGGWPRRSKGQAALPRLVVIGGGAGGASVARAVALAGPDIDVTLIESNRRYVTCFFSNLVLGGLRTLQSITHDYDRLEALHGITLVHGRAEAIDPDARQVRLDDGGRVPFDALVVAPGVDFRLDAIEGYSEAQTQMPHAYGLGGEVEPLLKRLRAMDDGGTFVIAPPPDPYRCPAAPYERVSMVARYFSREKPRSKILIVDAKDEFSEQALFESAWFRFYPGMIEWLPAVLTGGPQAVDVGDMAILTDFEAFQGDVVNVIPPQQAGRIAREAGLADASGWCPVDPATLESTLVPGVFLVGDCIAASPMPKSAFAANSQAQICAASVRTLLTGAPPPRPSYESACWSWLADDQAITVGARYAVAGAAIERVDPFISDPDEDDATRLANARAAEDWYATITREMFG